MNTFPIDDFLANFPPDLHGVVRARPQQEDRFERCLSAFNAWLANRRSTGLVLIGPTGRGKSAAAAFVARYAQQYHNQRPSFVSGMRLRDHLRGLPSEQRIMNYQDYLELVDPAAWPVCVLNDVGREKGRPEAEELVRSAIDWRSEWPVFTVITANSTPTDLLNHLGGDREESRIARYTWIDFTGLPDYRKER
jgi:DNA replication protein DnaC